MTQLPVERDSQNFFISQLPHSLFSTQGIRREEKRLTNLRVHGVSKAYNDKGETLKVLTSVSLQLDKNLLYCLSGPSGSGKTTLLNIVSGLDRPDEGEVWFDNVRIDTLSQEDSARLRANSIGVVFQNSNLVGHLTAVENVIFPTLFAGKNGETNRNYKERCVSLLNSLGLEDKLQKIPRKLSEGERRRVAIARAIIAKPKLILADEPTMNLDAENIARVLDLFGELKEEGSTVLLSTHDPSVAKSCDRIFRIDFGRITRMTCS
jgi:putative ABC transport system ATP-binding protein